jgi:hypothetical protein
MAERRPGFEECEGIAWRRDRRQGVRGIAREAFWHRVLLGRLRAAGVAGEVIGEVNCATACA